MEEHWKEIFRFNSKINGAMLYAYVNLLTEEVDLVQVNNEGESVTVTLTYEVAQKLVESLKHKR